MGMWKRGLWGVSRAVGISYNESLSFIAKIYLDFEQRVKELGEQLSKASAESNEGRNEDSEQSDARTHTYRRTGLT
jgi:hypothetical protein